MENPKNDHKLPAEEQTSSEDEIVKLATVRTWAKIFGLHMSSMQSKLHAANMKGINGRNAVGRLLLSAYYAENDVKDACRDLFLPVLSKEGIAFIGDKAVLGITKYALHRCCDRRAIMTAIEEAGLIPICKARSGKGLVDVYDKSQVDDLPCFIILSDSGVADCNGIQAIGVNKYARHRKVAFQTLRDAIAAAGLFSVGKANSCGGMIDLYNKSQVDVLPCFSPELPAIGIFDLNGIQVIGESKYAKYRHVSLSALHNAIIAAGLIPIGKMRSCSSMINLYEKSEVDAIITANAHKWKNLKNTEDVPDPQKANGESEE